MKKYYKSVKVLTLLQIQYEYSDGRNSNRIPIGNSLMCLEGVDGVCPILISITSSWIWTIQNSKAYSYSTIKIQSKELLYTNCYWITSIFYIKLFVLYQLWEGPMPPWSMHSFILVFFFRWKKIKQFTLRAFTSTSKRLLITSCEVITCVTAPYGYNLHVCVLNIDPLQIQNIVYENPS